MGFEETMVQLALAQADGNEELAINLLLNGEVRPTAPVPASSAAATADVRAIFSMGFDAALVRRALRQANDREEVAVEILLTGRVADRDEVRRFGTAPSSCHGTREEHEAAMECSIEAYMLQVTPAFSSKNTCDTSSQMVWQQPQWRSPPQSAAPPGVAAVAAVILPPSI